KILPERLLRPHHLRFARQVAQRLSVTRAEPPITYRWYLCCRADTMQLLSRGRRPAFVHAFAAGFRRRLPTPPARTPACPQVFGKTAFSPTSPLRRTTSPT